MTDKKGSGVLLIIVLSLFLLSRASTYLRWLDDPRSRAFWQWAQGDDAARAGLITAQRDACPGAPFILPTDGFIGLLYGDPRGPYSAASPHQGIDVFSDSAPGVTPVYAAYDGYVSRDDWWRSALIQRVPQDPLQPDRQIWLYYSHMAAADGASFIVDAFPPGARDVFVEQGTLLGYTGDYNGRSLRTIWTHLHFSIVKDDGSGRYLNELDFANTLDPSPYLGMSLHYNCAPIATGCTPNPTCP